MPKIERSRPLRNSSIVMSVPSSSLMLATRLRTDLVLLDLNFSGLTFREACTSSRLRSNINVPWLNMRPRVENWALPEIFCSPT
ncbi:hypothetical protein D3C73_1258150 [compost metagenome]